MLVNPPIYDRFFKALAHFSEKKGRGVQTFLAIEIGKSEGFVSSFLTGKKRASLETQADVAQAFGYDYEEFLAIGRRLLKGESLEGMDEIRPDGSFLEVGDLPNPECQFVKNFSDLPPNWKKFNKDFIAVPVVASEVAAGQPIISRKNIEGWAVIHMPRLKGRNNLVAIRVKSRSMEPTIRAGSIVCIDRDQQDIQPGKIYAVVWDNWTDIKRVYKEGTALQLISDNSDREFRQPQFVDMKKLDHNPVIGKVVWAWVDFENDV